MDEEKPPIIWMGEKIQLAEDIKKKIPPHNTYVEPFFGSGKVFFGKEPSRLEVINDINPELIKYLKVIQDKEKTI